MLEMIKKWVRNRTVLTGRRLALEEFENVAAGTWTVEQATEYRGEANSNNDFLHGWIGGWMDIGARDAKAGISRAEIFQNHAYANGWRQKMDELHRAGWRHSVLDAHLDAPASGTRHFCGGRQPAVYPAPGPLVWDE